ncbi:MAG TPA: DUF488 domain-containing protein [Alphaproteobacteria bacterium]|nr:DUF488 domain-containing protein [Alphaproteobacteria bacterium]
MTVIKLKRVYETADSDDGARILVDRLWPRGLARDKAHIDLWLKEIAPSDALRKRFHGKPEDWGAFKSAYAAELKSPDAKPAVEEILKRIRQGPVTLLYAARDEQHNNAVVLKQWLDRKAR